MVDGLAVAPFPVTVVTAASLAWAQSDLWGSGPRIPNSPLLLHNGGSLLAAAATPSDSAAALVAGDNQGRSRWTRGRHFQLPQPAATAAMIKTTTVACRRTRLSSFHSFIFSVAENKRAPASQPDCETLHFTFFSFGGRYVTLFLTSHRVFRDF